MRLRKQDLTVVYLKGKTTEDIKGHITTSYKKVGKRLEMNVQPAGGKVAAAIYGERLSYMKACKYQGSEIVEGKNENDGICLFVPADQNPDYKIVSIQTFSQHLNIMLERL